MQLEVRALQSVERQVAEQLIENAGKPHYERSMRTTELIRLLKTATTEPEEDFLAPLVPIVRDIAGDDAANVVSHMLAHLAEYPCSAGYSRRPFRSASRERHAHLAIPSVVNLLAMWRGDFQLLPYLSGVEQTEVNGAVSRVLAYELDRRNPEVLDALREILYGDNNTALVNRHMLKGIVLSHQPDAYRMLGELFIAARLQEGLRQSIVETADEGTVEAFLYFLDIIQEQGFIRYSSVLRAVDVWTGLSLEAAQPRVAKRFLDHAYQCLKEETVRQEYGDSADVLKLYASLWAAAVRSEEEAAAQIRLLMQKEEAYRRVVALYFLTQSQDEALSWSIAARQLHEQEPELQALVLANYRYGCSYSWSRDDEGDEPAVHVERAPGLEDPAERWRQFRLLKEMALQLPREGRSFSSNVFEWMPYTLSPDQPVEKMLYLTAYDHDPDKTAEVLELQDRVSLDLRNRLIRYFLKEPGDSRQRAFLFASLSDKSVSNREAALKRIKRLELSDRELLQIEELLKLKTGAIRQSAVRLLMSRPHEQWERTVERLLASRSELQRVAALEMLCERKEERESQPDLLLERFQQQLARLRKPTPSETTLLDRLNRQAVNGFANGFGLYDPKEPPRWRELPAEPGFRLRDWLAELPMARIRRFVDGLMELVQEHRDHEYAVDTGYSRESYLLGAKLERQWDLAARQPLPGLTGYPLTEVWRSYVAASGWTAEDLLKLAFLYASEELSDYYTDQMKRWRLQHFQSLTGWGKTFLEELYPMELLVEFHTYRKQAPYPQQTMKLAVACCWETPDDVLFPLVNRNLMHIISALQPLKPLHPELNADSVSLLVSPWLSWAGSRTGEDRYYREWFPASWNADILGGHEQHHVDTLQLARAFELGMVAEGELYRELLAREYRSRHHIQRLTDPKDEVVRAAPSLLPYRDRLLDTLLQLELNRGDLPTDGSALVQAIRYYEGMEHFLSILERLEQEAFVRGYIYGGNTKKEALSHLLRVCHPKPGEDEARLRELLLHRSIPDKRLLEAAMYAPQWLDLVAKHLQWQGLRSAAWYFHAHVNESFSAEKETIVAHYSPISPQDFNDGAFDVAWFQEAYRELGAERFEVLYHCARYISAGSNHRRAQRFADAVLGRLTLSDLRHAAAVKRNKDQLLAYSLVPLQGERDLLERYAAIQQFLKESKTFGAQRRASEAKAASIALDNLARNAGYEDLVRFTWAMEALQFEELRKDLEPIELEDGTCVRLSINGEGQADLAAEKGGKPLKSIPAKWKKHPSVVALKEKASELKEQYKRARAELERSMVSGSVFRGGELAQLLENPVLSPLLQGLVFQTDGGRLGFLTDSGLKGPDGTTLHPFTEEEPLRIAHPVHLYDSGQWSAFQRCVFERQLRQPFKQVFRELYLVHADEAATGTESRRYAGHQIQPKKAAALLRSRMWTASYEEGLQKVFYRDNLIACIYALADWFSPSEIEAPTLETVTFLDRRTYRPVELKLVPRLIFSEVMRDVELVVSVAHAGGVDPEASLTTIECRRAIVSETARLMKLSNVRVEGNYAQIAGTLGEYGIHLGSGSVYKMATGAVHIVPVHSQHRGRLFLPFLDEDPKTAEILSKVVLLAEDTKLKDPHILEQLK